MRDEGGEDAALAALEDDLAGALAAAREGRVRRRARGRRRGQEFAEHRAALDQRAGRGAKPFRQRLVDEEETARGIDRVEAHRRAVEEIRELPLLVADHLLHLVARGDVLEAPQHEAGPAGQPMRQDAEPGLPGAALGKRDAAAGRAALARVEREAREILGRRVARRDGARDRLERPRRAAEKAAKGGVGIGRGAVRPDDEVGLGRGLERLAQEREAADEARVHEARDDGGAAASEGKPDEQQRRRLRRLALEHFGEEKRAERQSRKREKEGGRAQALDPSGERCRGARRGVRRADRWRGRGRRQSTFPCNRHVHSSNLSHRRRGRPDFALEPEHVADDFRHCLVMFGRNFAVDLDTRVERARERRDFQRSVRRSPRRLRES